MHSKLHVLILGTVWPEPQSSAAGGRMMQLIDLFQSKGWSITFASAAADSEFMVDIEEVGIEKVRIELNSSSFDEFISTINPDIVVFDRFMVEEQFGWRVSENCPDALRILDTEDLHCLRKARQIALNEKRDFVWDDLATDIAKREIASILRCDISLIISEFEMDLLNTYFKVDPLILYHLPFMLDAINKDDLLKLPSFELRKNFICIGNFLHAPNVDAVMYLKEEIWPLIRKQLPEVEIHIYGAYPSQKILQLNNSKEGFIIKGRAKDAMEVVKQARVCLAPLRFGAGLKGKLVEAMLCGTPSVTTDIGVEGMQRDLEWNGIVVNHPKEFSEVAVELYSNPTLWKSSQNNAIEIIQTLFAKKPLGESLIHHILKVKGDLKKHRLRNFMGAMLMHHSLSSTKYMARWIEEKNK